MKKLGTSAAWFFMFFLAVLSFSCTKDNAAQNSTVKQSGKQQATITVGSKHFTEQEILGQLMAVLIEETTDIRVERKLNLGGTMICLSALKSGDIDLYAEYTGTGLVNILKMESMTDPERTYETVKREFQRKYGFSLLKPFGFNNTYTLTMRAGQAKELGVSVISDLSSFADILQPGFDAEFIERPDGLRGLEAHYGFKLTKRPKQMDPGLMYKALSEGAVDVIDAFATDGRIEAYGLLVLGDDKLFFPPYHAAPLVREETLKAHPELEDVLQKLSGLISDEQMQRLNFSVDNEGLRPVEAAREFLAEKGLISVNK